MKFLILLLILTSSIFAVTINESLLKIHATLLPKLYLMDYSYAKKIKNNSITMAIMYHKSEYKNALSLKNKIETRYSNGLKSYKIEVQLVLYSNIENSNANIYYLFPTNSKNIKNVVKKANEKKALTFSYLKDDLKYGVMISLVIGIKVKPILNLNAIKVHNISFRPILLNISSIFINKYSSCTHNKVQFT